VGVDADAPWMANDNTPLAWTQAQLALALALCTT